MNAPTPDLRSALGFQVQTTMRWAVGIPRRLADKDWLARPAGVRNHCHWIYGHVVLSSDFSPELAEVERIVPASWEAMFGPGSRPLPDGSGYPSPRELQATVERTMERNLEVLGSLDPETLSAPPRIPILEDLAGFLRTRERWLAFSCLHLCYHLGQIALIHRTLHPEAEGH